MAVTCSDDELRVSLSDGRWLSVPVVWSPRLAHATLAERANYELLGEGEGIHWPDVDEDISVFGLARLLLLRIASPSLDLRQFVGPHNLFFPAHGCDDIRQPDRIGIVGD